MDDLFNYIIGSLMLEGFDYDDALEIIGYMDEDDLDELCEGYRWTLPGRPSSRADHKDETRRSLGLKRHIYGTKEYKQNKRLKKQAKNLRDFAYQLKAHGNVGIQRGLHKGKGWFDR